jgi:hypothetical protein
MSVATSLRAGGTRSLLRSPRLNRSLNELLTSLTTLQLPAPGSTFPRSPLHLSTMMRQLNDDAEAVLTVTRSKNAVLDVNHAVEASC